MIEIMLGVALMLQIVVIVFVIRMWRTQASSDTGTLKTTCESLQKGQERLEVMFREEMVANRREAGDHARVAREENNVSLKNMGESLGTQLSTHLKTASDAQQEQLVGFGSQLRTLVEGSKNDAAQLRAELSKSFTQFSESLLKQVTDSTALQSQRFDQFDSTQDWELSSLTATRST